MDNSREDSSTAGYPVNRPLNGLLVKSTKMASNMDTTGDLPVLSRGFNEMERLTKALSSKAARSETGSSKGQALLASKGFDSEKFAKDLQSINMKSTFDPLEPLSDTDIQGYLRNEHELMILTVFEEAKKNTINEFYESHIKSVEEDWAAEKREILEALGNRFNDEETVNLAGGGGDYFNIDTRANALNRRGVMEGGRDSVMNDSAMNNTGNGGVNNNNGSGGVLNASVVSSVAGQGGLGRGGRFGAGGSGSGAAAQMRLRGRSVMSGGMMNYATVVRSLNDHRLQNEPFGLISCFEEVAVRSDDIRKEDLRSLWSLLACMIGESDVVNGVFQKDIVCENQFVQLCSASFAGDEGSTTAQTKLKHMLVTGAKKYLEQQYMAYISATVKSQATRSRLGGVPGTVSFVKAFLNVVYGEEWPEELEDYIDDYPLWAIIFYCMRVGDVDAAWKVAQSYEAKTAELLPYFREYIESADGILSLSSSQNLQSYYRVRSRGNSDPYKLAVINLIGKFDVLDNFSSVCPTLEDYLWLRLSLITESPVGTPAGDSSRFTLDKFRTTLDEFGPGHFQQGNNPLSYFKILLITGQFERAINYLLSVSNYDIDAVHFAVALNYYGLLRTMGGSGKRGGDSSCNVVNFPRTIIQYTHSFSRTDPREALDYYFLLSGNEEVGNNGIPENTFIKCVKELVLETREAAMILGSLQNDGTRKAGCIDRFLKNPKDASFIIQSVAASSENDGLFEDAVLLYDLAKNHRKVLSILNKQLSTVLTLPGGGPGNAQRGSGRPNEFFNKGTLDALPGRDGAASDYGGVPFNKRDTVHSLAHRIESRYRNMNILYERTLSPLSSVFQLLLNLMKFFDLFRSNRLEDALACIENLNLIPLEQSEMNEKVEAFRSIPDEVRSNFADILLTTMSVLYNIHKSVKDNQRNIAVSLTGDGGRDQFLKSIRQKARVLITFMGMIQYRMPGDTNARMVRMDVLMN